MLAPPARFLGLSCFTGYFFGISMTVGRCLDKNEALLVHLHSRSLHSHPSTQAPYGPVCPSTAQMDGKAYQVPGMEFFLFHPFTEMRCSFLSSASGGQESHGYL
ncbi:hypothetical protein F5Y08DRAFT_294084, partial [Xylaria arbuscula]